MSNTSSNKPDMKVYAVRQYGKGRDKKSSWNPIGAAWRHSDGEGFNLRIDFLPAPNVECDLVMRTPMPENEEANAQIDNQQSHEEMAVSA